MRAVAIAVHALIRSTFFPLIFGFSYRANWEEWEPQQFGESGQCQITQHLVRQGKNLNRLIDQREFRQGGDVV